MKQVMPKLFTLKFTPSTFTDTHTQRTDEAKCGNCSQVLHQLQTPAYVQSMGAAPSPTQIQNKEAVLRRFLFLPF